ncbi:hypothetical protein GW17_00060783 [Ensete ventricosum]|nr:hypothetical protein GW17_00060783 [Ensete ventricosum]RZS27978.1 hypothetical protein BHM03_00061525 [Ensete ventricosum]
MRALGYKKVVAKLYNRKVCPRQIKASDLVLRKVEVSDPTRSWGKLAPNWEGPYRVESTAQDETYALVTMKENDCQERGTYQTCKNFMCNKM